ncbi:MAG TPA: ATP-dependent DNA helicase RecG, partial [Alphaproteobacteria bacterium]|nr:ATP-dependent DNA helicase RecG [Alphaproteobacteria bacterium]
MSRPFALDPLFRALTTLPGVGPKNAKLFEKLTGGPKILDLLWHLPVDVIDRSAAPSLADVKPGQVITIEVTVDKHAPNQRKSQPYRVWCRGEGGAINLVFFHMSKPWIEKILPPGEQRIISGRVEFYNGQPQILHPDAIVK